MPKRNPTFAKLSSNYLFPEINRRKKLFLEAHPDAQLISLGIGDTTEPLPLSISTALSTTAENLGTKQGYSGYGPEQGVETLRKKIAEKIYQNKIPADDIFISDGAKCDIGRIQKLFGKDISVAVQDPAYPVYVDGSLLEGVQNIHFLACHPENNFNPDLSLLPPCDLIYWCSPNNPTGAVSSRAELQNLVSYAKNNKAIIIFDNAYSAYIQGDEYPRSIYEIEGATEVAIELNSFSKLAGFSGIRLGWSVVPAELTYEDGLSVKNDWKRLISTIFNGASNIAQQGGLAVLQDKGYEDIQKIVSFYLANAAILKNVLIEKGYDVFGADHTPYLWVKTPNKTSWESFQEILDKTHLITTPGSGFGPSGEGFLRLSAFGSRETILEAAKRLKEMQD